MRRKRTAWWLAALWAAGCSQPTPKPEPAASATPSAVASAPPAPSPTPPPPPPPPPPPVTLATEGGRYDVIDLHVDTPWRVHFKGREAKLDEGHATGDLLEKGSYAGIVYPIYIPDYIHDWKPTVEDADAIFDTIDRIVDENDFLVRAPVEPGDAPVPDDKVAVYVSIEGAGAFAANIEAIDRFVERGVRLIGPVHAHDNDLSTAATGKGKGGLTDDGKAFCERIYRAGALVDVSHMSDAGFDDLVPIAGKHDAPIVATHSNARKLRGHPRNLTDEQLKTIAASGGVAGLNLHRTFIRKGKAKMSHVVKMVQHMIDVAGVDHVAIGTDFDGGTPVPPVKNAGKLAELAEALQKAGVEEADLRKIFGGNALRVLTWKPEAQ